MNQPKEEKSGTEECARRWKWAAPGLIIGVVISTIVYYAAEISSAPTTRHNKSPPGSMMCSSSNTTTAIPSIIRVAYLGDSITRGDGSHEKMKEKSRTAHEKKSLPGRGNYPQMLQSMLGNSSTAQHQQSFFDVRNFGHGGATASNTSSTGVPYINTKEYQEALLWKPHIVVIMLGTNDIRQNNITAFGSGLDQIISRINNNNNQTVSSTNGRPMIVLVPPPPILNDKNKIWRNKKILPEIRKEIRTRGSDTASCDAVHGITVTTQLPIPEVTAMFMEDGVHLNRNGTLRLACVVFNELMVKCHDGWTECFGGDDDDNDQHDDEWRQAGEMQCKGLITPKPVKDLL